MGIYLIAVDGSWARTVFYWILEHKVAGVQGIANLVVVNIK